MSFELNSWTVQLPKKLNQFMEDK